MSITHRVKRLVGISLAGAMVLALMPAGIAAAQTVSTDDVEACEGSEGLVSFNDNLGFFESEIECMAAFGITVGDAEGNYNSTGTVTRQQMALFIARLASQALNGDIDSIPDFEDDAFDDIADINPPEARDAINWLADLEITVGTEGGNSYDPSGPVTRQQMASFIARAHEALGVDFSGVAVDDERFDDVDAGNVHFDSINLLAAAGVVEGTGDGSSYSPTTLVTRGQMSAFIVRSIGVLEAQGLWNGVFIVEPAGGFDVNLSWENEVNPNATGPVDETDPTQFGWGQEGAEGNIALDVDDEGLTFELTVTGLETAPTAIAGSPVHIHEAAFNANGPVVVILGAEADYDYDAATQTLTGSGEGAVNPAEADANIFAEIQADQADYYVNVHSEGVPSGAVRGQLPDGGQDLLPAGIVQQPEPSELVAATSAPDLTDVALVGQNASEAVLRYTFDAEVAPGTDIVGGNFSIHGWDTSLVDTGEPQAATSTRKDPNDPNSVLVYFDKSTGSVVYDDAIVAVAGAGAVQNISGTANLANTAPLNDVTVDDIAAGVRLLSVGNAQDLGTATATIDFVFDADVSGATQNTASSAFIHVLSDGSTLEVFAGDGSTTNYTVETTDETNDTLRVTVGSALTQAALDTVERAYVDASVLTGITGLVNTSVDVGGVATAGPDLVSVEYDAEGDDASFTFSANVTGTVANTGFELLLADGTAVTSTGAVRDAGDLNVVNVDFAPNSVDDTVIFATALEGAVTQFSNALSGERDTAQFSLDFAAGDSNGPDFVAVAVAVTDTDVVSGDPTQYTITLTFDKEIQVGGIAVGDLGAWDEDAATITLAPTSVTADGSVDVEVVFNSADAGFDEITDGDIAVWGVGGNQVDQFGYASYPVLFNP